MDTIYPFSSFMSLGVFITILVLLSLWSIVWKGLALWRAARLSQQWWFIALLVINTLGILEILYLFVFSKKESRNLEEKVTSEELGG